LEARDGWTDGRGATLSAASYKEDRITIQPNATSPASQIDIKE